MRMETRGERCFRGGVAVSVLLRTNTNEGRQPGSESRRADGSRTPRASRGCGSSPPSAPAQPAAPQSAGGGGRPGACPAASQRSRRFKRSRASRPLRPLLPPAGGGAAGEKARAGREAPIGSRPRGWRSGAARAGPSSSPLSARSGCSVPEAVTEPLRWLPAASVTAEVRSVRRRAAQVALSDWSSRPSIAPESPPPQMSRGRFQLRVPIGCAGAGGVRGGRGSRRPLCVGTSSRPSSREAAAAILCVSVFSPTPAPLSAAAGTPRAFCRAGEAKPRPRAGPREPPGAAKPRRSQRERGKEEAKRKRGGTSLRRCPPTGGGVSAPGPGAAPAWRTHSSASCSSAASTCRPRRPGCGSTSRPTAR